MFTNFSKQSYGGFGVGTLVSSAPKKCFQRGSLTQVARDHMERNANTREKTLIGSIYIPPGNENHLHILDMELEKHKFENILLIGGISIAETKHGTEALTMIAECVSYLKLLLIDMAFT